MDNLVNCGNADELRQRGRSALAQLNDLLKKILEVEGERTEKNTLEPHNELLHRLGRLWSAVACTRSVHPEEQLRKAAEEMERDIAKFATELGLNQELYRSLKGCDASRLDPQAQRLVEHTLRDFHRAGVDRDEATRQRVRALREELVAVEQELHRNIVKDVRSIELDGPEELDGLPSDYVRDHKPGENGKIRITTDYPDYNPFMTYARSGERRRQLYIEFRRRGYPDNLGVLDQIIRKRHELAVVLGYPSWAAYVAEDKMIKTPEAIAAFIDRVSAITEVRARADYQVLLERKRKEDPAAVEVLDWEKTYFENLLRSERFEVDSKVVRSYFEYGRVKAGILSLVERLFGVEFRPNSTEPRWHEDVEVLDVLDDGRMAGRVYLDMFPREGKFKHAAMFPLVRGVQGIALPEAALVCNFPNPRRTQGPALLEHEEVLTFLHEFGHLLHQLFAVGAKWVKFSGVSNEWDFIEVPSQLFEEWGWDYEVLKGFAMHHSSRKPIPADLVERLTRAKSFGRSLWVRHQMFYAAVSLGCYGPDAPTLDTSEVVRAMQTRHSLFRFVEGTYFQASFGHLDDYSALYYTYMWSLVIEKDIHEAWSQQGLLSKDAAQRYLSHILRPGSSRDAVDLVRSYLGRDYSFQAFESWLDQTGARVPTS